MVALHKTSGLFSELDRSTLCQLFSELDRYECAAAQRSVIIIATCADILDEREHLLGNDGRLGSFPDPAERDRSGAQSTRIERPDSPDRRSARHLFFGAHCVNCSESLRLRAQYGISA